MHCLCLIISGRGCLYGYVESMAGQLVYLCFSTDFLIEDADKWRSECWKMIREQCLANDVHFEFRQCVTHFIKEGKVYNIKVRDLCSQAGKADINF